MQNWLVPSKESKGDLISRLSRPEEMIPGTTAMDAQQMPQNQVSRKRPAVAAAAKNPKKKKKKKKAEASANDWFQITKGLYDWYKNNTIHSQIGNKNTEAAKELCEENGLPYSGAKWALRERLIAHCKLAEFREENNLCVTIQDGENMTSITLNDNANADDDDDAISTTGISQDFASKKLTYAAARKLYRKHIKDVKAPHIQAAARLKITIAASRGMDNHLLEAITGKDRKKYNGSRGEEGLELQEEICTEFANLYDYIKGSDDKKGDELLAELLVFCQKENSSKCEAYGFQRYDHFIKNKL